MRGVVHIGSHRRASPSDPHEKGGISPLDIGAMFISATIIGIAVAPIMVDVGTPKWVVLAAAFFAWSGTGEVAYASVIDSGGSTIAAWVASMLVSSRFALLALSLKGRWQASVLERVGMYQYASEVGVANAIDQQRRIGSHAARRVFWQLATPMASGWFIGSVLGLLLGNIVGDTRQIGLDVVFPASFIGTVVSGLRRRDSAVAVGGGLTAALGLSPFLPAGLPILIAALTALVAVLVPVADATETAE
ncbi:MAG: putative branched-subunit amino acid permease [Acidimicrobiales bacterium]|jgi:predicted branched-subunit amino acid permease